MTDPRPPRQRKPLLACAGFLLLALFSYFGYAVVSSQREQARVAETFPPVAAIVESSAVKSMYMDRNVRRYRVRIAYRYSVRGHQYRSTRYSYLGPGFASDGEARAVVARYPKGARFTAFYDPENPADAVVHREPPALSAAVMAVPFVLFGFIGLLMLVLGLRGTPRSSKASPR